MSTLRYGMRLDHIAYRVADRKATSQFFIEAFGYKIQQEFTLDFPDGTHAQCIALEPPEKTAYSLWTVEGPMRDDLSMQQIACLPEYHCPPELFVSDGDPGSIVANWVAKRDGIGGIHHMAYQVKSVEETMKYWTEKGWAEFASNKPMTCPGLTQVFSRPHPLTGIIYEFIERGEFGFCKDNVKALMVSTAGL